MVQQEHGRAGFIALLAAASKTCPGGALPKDERALVQSAGRHGPDIGQSAEADAARDQAGGGVFVR